MAYDDNDSVMVERLKDVIFKQDPKGLQSLLKTASSKCVKVITSDPSVCVLDVHCLRILLDYISNIDYIDSIDPFGSHTMLTEAARIGNLECIRLLLDRGANINARNGNGETALMMACDDELEEIFDLLIKRRADIHVSGINGNAVGMAAHRNAVKCLHKLVSLGANIQVRNCFDQTPFSIACETGHKEFMNALLSYMKPCNDDGLNARDKTGKTPLMFSCEGGYAELSEILLKYLTVTDINAQDTKGWTALMYATSNNSVECFQLLMKNGASVDIVDNLGSTLFSSAVRGIGDILKLLLHNGTVLHDGMLKAEHKAGLSKSISLEEYFSFHFNSVSLLMAHNIFDWDWCVQEDLKTFVPPAVRFSICPGIINYNGYNISMLPLAFVRVDASTVKFLLAHRYFYPNDFSVISTNMSFRSKLKFDSPYDNSTEDELSKILDRLTLHPLSLQTWSFLTISKAISLAGTPTGRTDIVNALPLPERVKQALRFQTNITELCPYEWENISIDQAFDSLNFRREIFWEEELKCDTEECLECGGSYYLFKAHAEC